MVLMLFSYRIDLRVQQTQKCDDADISIAIPSLFGKPSYPTIPLEPLQREQPLKNIETRAGGSYPVQWKTHPQL
jgi:hypothetical protein